MESAGNGEERGGGHLEDEDTHYLGTPSGAFSAGIMGCV